MDVEEATMDPQLGTILLDVTPGGDGVVDRAFLERNSHHVLTCHGPDAGAECPLVAGTGCSLVDSAHGVIFALDLDRADQRAILERYRKVLAPEVPMRVVVRPGQMAAHPDLLGGVEVWETEPSVADLDGFAARVEAADRDTG
jgi:hypothetical protein